jgi:hypothetical protein
MLVSIIPLPAGFVTDITANLGTILTDLAPYLTLILGVLLGMLVVGFLVDMLKR